MQLPRVKVDRFSRVASVDCEAALSLFSSGVIESWPDLDHFTESVAKQRDQTHSHTDYCFGES